MQLKIINGCKNGNLEELYNSILVERDNIDFPDIWGRRALYYATRSKNIHAIKMLCDHGATLTLTNTINGNEEDLIITAFRTSSNDTISCIFELFSKTEIGQDHVQSNLLGYLPYLFRNDSSILEQFVRRFYIKSLKDYESTFCRTGKQCHYELMIAYNVCFDLQCSLRFTLVYGRYNAFDFLLTRVRYSEQLDYIYRGPHGSQQTLLSLCCTNGYYKGLVKLIDAGANMFLASVNERGETRNNLMAAVDNCQYKALPARGQIMVQRCVRYLMRFYDINDQNSRGQTALMFANRSGSEDLTRLLIELGANQSIVDMNGYQA